MFGSGAFSALAFSVSRDMDRRYYLDIGSFDVTASFDFRIFIASSAGFASQPTDALRSQYFRPVFKSYSLRRDIVGSEIGVYTSAAGRLVFSNADAFYDFLPADYSLEGQELILRATRRDGSYDQAYPFAHLMCTGWSLDRSQIVMDVTDSSYKLRVPMQPHLYAGTGGAEGGSDLEGKRKPISLGACREVPGVLLDANKWTYQYNDGPSKGVLGVRVRGIALTKGADYPDYASMEAATITPGHFVTCNAGSYYRLEELNSDDIGHVTADVEGDNRDGYIQTHADIVRWALRNRTAISDPTGLDTNSFAAVNAAQPAAIDRFLGPDDDLTVEDFIADIMGGAGGWGGFRRDDRFGLWIFSAPEGEPVQAFGRNDMIGDDIDRESLPDAYRPPPWRWRVISERCWSGAQTELAGGVDAAHRQFVAQDYRLGEASREAIKVDYRFPQDREPVKAYYSRKADATTESLRRINLFRTTRAPYRWTVNRKGLLLEIGDVVKVIHPRFGLSAGRLMRVIDLEDSVEVTDNGVIEQVRIRAYG